MIRTLANHPYANAHIESNEYNGVTLYSYSTPVVNISWSGWVKVNGLYSMTTRKHISYFMREFDLSYQLAKELYEKNLKYNIYTGEITGV